MVVPKQHPSDFEVSSREKKNKEDPSPGDSRDSCDSSYRLWIYAYSLRIYVITAIIIKAIKDRAEYR